MWEEREDVSEFFSLRSLGCELEGVFILIFELL